MSNNEEPSRRNRNQNKYRRMNPQDYEKNEGDSVFSRRQAPEKRNTQAAQPKRTEARPNYDQVRDTAPRRNYDEGPNQNAGQNNYRPQNGGNPEQNQYGQPTNNEQPTYSNRPQPSASNPRRQRDANPRFSGNNSGSNRNSRGNGISCGGRDDNRDNGYGNGYGGGNNGNGGSGGNGGGGNNLPPQNGGSGYNGTPQPKRRKKHHILRNLVIILLLICAVMGVQYYRGVQSAKKVIGAATVTETFNGSKADDGSTNVLLIGSDQRPKANETSRADTIMILHLGKGQKKPKLISIMRDTYVAIPGHDKNKINAAYAYGGAELLRQTIEQNFGITLRYYVRVDFESFENVIDELYPKGVDINAEKDLDLDGVTIKAGEQKMTGHVLLQYARFRHDEEGDFGRIRRQQQVINALIQQAKSPATLLNLPKATGAGMTYTSTNLPVTFAATQGISYLFKGATGVDRLSVPVENSWSYATYQAAGSVIEINFDTNKQAISKFFGE